LKERLDTEHTEVTAQLAEIVTGDVTETETVLKDVRKYSNDKNTLLNTSRVVLQGNETLEKLNVNTSGTEAVIFETLTNDHEIKDTVISGQSIGVHINKKNVKNINVQNSKISVSGGYPLLLNAETQGGENASFINNHVKTPSGDGIAINTPSETPDEFRGIRVIGNFIDCGLEGDATNNGFAISVAQGKDVVIIGNVTKGARQEQLHIEDCSENVSVIGNVFNNCNYDGARILNKKRSDTLYAKIPLVIGNHFKATNNKKTHRGLYRVFDSRGIVDGLNFTNNRLEGFDTGIWLEGGGVINANGVTIENCNVAVRASGKVKGSIVSSNTPKLLSLWSRTEIDDISSLTPIDANGLFTNNLNANAIAKINKFAYPLTTYTSLANTTNKVKLFKIPRYMKGSIYAKVQVSGGSNFIDVIGDIEIIDNEITFTKGLSKSYGAYANANIVLSNGYVCLSYWTSNDIQNMKPNVEFTGVYVLDSTTV